MNKWVVLAALAVGSAAFLGGVVAVVGWLARRHDRRHETFDDGSRLSLGSPLDHLAMDQARDDAHPHD
jgi:hypothetical protein